MTSVFVLLGLISWVGSMVGCYYLGNHKGRDGDHWMSAAFFLGVLALLALVLMPSKI